MAEPSPADIFLSHPGESPDVHALRQLLEYCRLNPWVSGHQQAQIDKRGESSIRRAIRRVPIFIRCVDTRPMGAWTEEELALAEDRAGEDNGFEVATVLLPGSQPARQGESWLAETGRNVFNLSAGVDLQHAADLILWCWAQTRPRHFELFGKVIDLLGEEGSLAILAGPPLSGKSALARLVAVKLGDSFSRIVHVRSRQVTEEAAMAAALRELGEDSVPSEAADLTAAYWERFEKTPCLLIFDNLALDHTSELIPPRPSATLMLCEMPPSVTIPEGGRGGAIISRVPDPFDEDADAESGPIPETLAGYVSDVPAGTDLLSIRASVNALSSLVAARQVTPPLSIGLFGDWGAGKSFFIEKMQERVALLASASSMRPAESDYCPSIHQIVFNAWHYADSNLWASLASRIFEVLAQKETEHEKLIAELESSRLQREDAESEQEIASRRLKAAGKSQDETKDRVGELESELRTVTAAPMRSFTDDEETRRLLSLGGSLAELWCRSKLSVLGLVALVAAGIAVALALPGFAASVVGVAVAAVGAIGFLAGLARFVDEVHREARRRAEERRLQRQRRIEADLSSLQEAERQAGRRASEARREIEETTLAIEEIKSGRRLYRFIEERSRAEAYGPYLGLVALVRRDFERFGELIAEREAANPNDPKAHQRIVLYIDDLDRCSASRVVEVLEAVHLLLASKLFVVVVAVDPRWLLKSLGRHYVDEMTDTAGTAAPQDYLEKIFQIPFSLKQMDDDGFRRLIESLVPVEPQPGFDGAVAVEEPASKAPDGEAPAPTESPTSPDLPTRKDDGAGGPNLKPDGLLVTSEEVEFMFELGPLIRTPRATKRLANLYRLLRVSLSETELGNLVGDTRPRPEFPCVQLLLTVAVGFPSVSPSLFKAVLASSGDSKRWWQFVESFEPPSGREKEWSRLFDRMAPLHRADVPTELAAFARWVPVVERYSYGLQELSQPEAAGTSTVDSTHPL